MQESKQETGGLVSCQRRNISFTFILTFNFSLTKQEILSELLDLILQEPAEDVEEKVRFKLPNIASEVITCDVAQVSDEHFSCLLVKIFSSID